MRVADLRAGTHRTLAADPAGARVVAGALLAARAGALWRIDLTSGERTRLAEHVPDSQLSFAPDGSYNFV